MAEGVRVDDPLRARGRLPTVTRVATDGQPGVFATLDAGASRTVGLYFMYDVKQVDPAEWSSPPWEASIVDKPGFGKVIDRSRRGEPEGSRIGVPGRAPRHPRRRKKVPVNLVMVAEGEEEIGSPHFHQVVRRPRWSAALRLAARASSCPRRRRTRTAP